MNFCLLIRDYSLIWITKLLLCNFLIGWALGSPLSLITTDHETPRNRHTCGNNTLAGHVRKLYSPELQIASGELSTQLLPHLRNWPYIHSNQSLKLAIIHSIHRLPQTSGFNTARKKSFNRFCNSIVLLCSRVWVFRYSISKRFFAINFV
jgi:hypothetical protein